MLVLTALLAMSFLVACGEKPGAVVTKTEPKARLLIVSSTPVLHEMVSTLMEDRADTHCLLRTDEELRHGDLSAQSVLMLRVADVVFDHEASPFPHVSKAIEAGAKAERVVRVGTRSEDAVAAKIAVQQAQQFSLMPRDVLIMLDEVEIKLVAIDAPHAASIHQRSAQMRSSIKKLDDDLIFMIDQITPEYRMIATDDPAIATVIRALGFKAVLIPAVSSGHPTVADREAMIAAINAGKARALAINARESETMRELIADIAKATGARMIVQDLSPWPRMDETYGAWMNANMNSIFPKPPKP